MTETKRFTDDGIEEIENQSFTDNLTEKTYWIDNGLDDIVELLNDLNDENKQLKSENNSYKNMFFEIVETALTDTNCKELYCKGILDIFDKANSLNQAREMIKEHLK